MNMRDVSFMTALTLLCTFTQKNYFMRPFMTYVNYFTHREINRHNTKDHSKQLLRIIITYSEIPLKSFLLYVSVVTFCPKQTLSSFKLCCTVNYEQILTEQTQVN